VFRTKEAGNGPIADESVPARPTGVGPSWCIKAPSMPSRGPMTGPESAQPLRRRIGFINMRVDEVGELRSTSDDRTLNQRRQLQRQALRGRGPETWGVFVRTAKANGRPPKCFPNRAPADFFRMP